MQFYTQDDNGDYVEATDKVDSIVQTRLSKYKASEQNKIRTEVEDTIRQELKPVLTEELKSQIESEYKPKLDEAENKLKKLDVQVRQKTIAAEYGFGADIESFLGDGDDDDMRAKADILKKNHQTPVKAPVKNTADGNVSSIQKRTGIKVDIQ